MCNTYYLICGEGNEWTAFNPSTEEYKYLIMPFGLFNVPVILQTQMNDVLCDIFNWHVFIYLDDILIFSRYREQHIHQAWSVFQHLLKNSLYIKAEQWGWGLSDPCAFFSCCLSTAERNSDIGKRELFTISYSGTIGWRLPIRPFVWTDHKNKIYLLRPCSPVWPQSFPVCRGPQLVCLLGSTPAQWTG